MNHRKRQNTRAQRRTEQIAHQLAGNFHEPEEPKGGASDKQNGAQADKQNIVGFRGFDYAAFQLRGETGAQSLVNSV